MNVTLGQWLRLQREAAGMGLHRLAVLLGIDPSHVSRIENDHVPLPRRLLRPWADALGCDSDELHYRAGRVPPDLQPLLTENPQLRQDVRELLKG